MKTNENIFSNKEKAMFSLRKLYAEHGFSMYRMSKFEKFELYAENMDFLDSGQIITFTDTDGMLMALKPDVTLSCQEQQTHRKPHHQAVLQREHLPGLSEDTLLQRDHAGGSGVSGQSG